MDWDLSDVGRNRAEAFARVAGDMDIATIVSSVETMTMETANAVSRAIDVPAYAHADTHENDRSATGYLPAEEFERVATMIFADSSCSIRGSNPMRNSTAHENACSTWATSTMKTQTGTTNRIRNNRLLTIVEGALSS